MNRKYNRQCKWMQWMESKNTFLFDPNVIQDFLWTEGANGCSGWKVKILWFLILMLFKILINTESADSLSEKKSKNISIFDPKIIQYFLWTESAPHVVRRMQWMESENILFFFDPNVIQHFLWIESAPHVVRRMQ